MNLCYVDLVFFYSVMSSYVFTFFVMDPFFFLHFFVSRLYSFFYISYSSGSTLEDKETVYSFSRSLVHIDSVSLHNYLFVWVRVSISISHLGAFFLAMSSGSKKS
ncbi:hypothetical protein BZA77DRAFT_85888 [Pyronema omphalodes]|nr:hypothetical protein BZA77DRAFT_85888 [Pyronema omphalodes]